MCYCLLQLVLASSPSVKVNIVKWVNPNMYRTENKITRYLDYTILLNPSKLTSENNFDTIFSRYNIYQ